MEAMETDPVVKDRNMGDNEKKEALVFPEFLRHLGRLELAQWAILIRKKTTGNLASKFQERMLRPPRWEVRYTSPFSEGYQWKTKNEQLTRTIESLRDQPATLATVCSQIPNDFFFFNEQRGETRPSTPTVHRIKYRGDLFPWIKNNQLLGAYFGAVNPSVLEYGNRLEHLDKDLYRDPEDAQFKRKMNHKMSQMLVRMRVESLRREYYESRSQENDENRDPSGRQRRYREPNPNRARQWHPSRYYNIQNQQVVRVVTPSDDDEREEPYVFFQYLPSDTYYELAYELTVELNTEHMTVERRAKKLKHFDWCHSLWVKHRFCEAAEHGDRECNAEYFGIFQQMTNLYKRHMNHINKRIPWRDDRQRAEWVENFLADTPPVEFENSDDANDFWGGLHKKVMEIYYDHPKEAFMYELKQAISNLLYFCKLYAKEDNEEGGNSTYEKLRDDALRNYETWDDVRNILKATIEEGHPNYYSSN